MVQKFFWDEKNRRSSLTCSVLNFKFVGIVEPLKIMIMDLSRLRKGNDDRIIIETLIELLRIVDNLLKYVSEFVKKALQIKKIAGANDNIAQQAEKLLHSNKQFVVCNQFLISLVNLKEIRLEPLK
jgi:hypothetical protein